MLVVYAILITGVIIANVLFWVPYSVHREMVRDNCRDKYANGNFTQFIKEFANRSWERHNPWYYSYFGIDDDYYTNQIHADVIKFDGVGMVLDPVSYLRFKIWTYKTALPKPNKSKEYKDYWKKRDNV